jgi:hypothetical protein
MKRIFQQFSITIILHVVIAGKVILFPEEKIEYCNVDKKPLKSVDPNTLEVLVMNDYEVFMNGSTKNLLTLKSPWKVHLWAEEWKRGEWLMRAFDRTYPDFCKNLHSPLEPFYIKSRKLQGCPIKAGVKIVIIFM